MDQGKLSVASVAVDVAREVFDTFADKTVLVIGAGKMGDLTLQHLKALQPRPDPGHQPQPRAGRGRRRAAGAAGPSRSTGSNLALIEADVVVSTTAADEPIVTLEQYARVQRARRNRLALILDIAIPRDFDPRIGDLDQVMLYNVDDLRAQAEQNRQPPAEGGRPGPGDHRARDRRLLRRAPPPAPRRRRPPPARRLRRRRSAAASSTPSSPRRPDLDRRPARGDRPHGPAALQNQFLHHPRAALRSAASDAPPDEHPHPLLNAVRHLFGLADGS